MHRPFFQVPHAMRQLRQSSRKGFCMNLIIIGDFGKDMDDEDTLVLSDGVNRHQLVCTEGSRKQELFEMLAVVANLAPATQRARLAKGTLKELRRPKVPVGIGTDCGMRADGHEREFVAV